MSGGYAGDAPPAADKENVPQAANQDREAEGLDEISKGGHEVGPVRAATAAFDPKAQKYYDNFTDAPWSSFYDLIPDANLPFIHSTDKRECLRFAELKRFIAGPACQIEGLGRTDRLCTVMPNGPELAVAFFAFSIRCVFAPLNLFLSRAEFEFEFEDLPCACLVVQDKETLDEDEGMAAGSAVAVARKQKVKKMLNLKPNSMIAGLFELAKHPASRPPKDAPKDFDPSPHTSVKRTDLALVLHTSGTTKKPKIVPLTHENIGVGAQCIATTVQVTKSDVCINVMPLFHIHGQIVNILQSAVSGAQVLCVSGLFNAEKFWEAATKSNPKPTWYSAVPTMHNMIVGSAEEQLKHTGKPPNHTIKLIRNCSAALVPSVSESMEKLLKVVVMPTYAMTESMPISSNPRYGKIKLRSVGPRGGPNMRIMEGHPSKNVLPVGVEGEVCVKDGPVTGGYEFRPHMDEDPNIEGMCDGWLRTGDKGWIDDEGYLYLSGRFKEIINRGGEKISPFEIEDVMRQHEGVKDLIAFAAPHVTLGETVGVALVRRDTHKDLSLRDLRQWAHSGGLLQVKWLPECAVFLPTAIPKGPTGKPARIGLAKRVKMEPLGAPGGAPFMEFENPPM